MLPRINATDLQGLKQHLRPMYDCRALVVAQLVERSLPTPEIRGLNPDIGKILSANCTIEKTKIKKKRPGIFFFYDYNAGHLFSAWYVKPVWPGLSQLTGWHNRTANAISGKGKNLELVASSTFSAFFTDIVLEQSCNCSEFLSDLPWGSKLQKKLTWPTLSSFFSLLPRSLTLHWLW